MHVYLRGLVPLVQWGHNFNLSENVIASGTITIVRVTRGMHGLAVQNGKPMILDQGLHVKNSPIFTFNRFVKVDSEHISHMSYNVMRVPSGFFGKVTENMTPKLLAEGLHAVDNPIFEYRSIVPISDQHISNGTVHVIQVAKGSLGLIMESSFPRLLEEGVHIFDSSIFKFMGVQSKLSKLIQHGTITRFRVEMGEVATTLC